MPRGGSRIDGLPGRRLGFLALPVRLCKRQVAQEVAHERVSDDALQAPCSLFGRICNIIYLAEQTT